MKYQGKEINDECSRCGSIFECVLFIKGHGIGTEREHVADMIRCQFKHQEKSKNYVDNNVSHSCSI